MQECSLESLPGCYGQRVALVPPQWSHCSGDPQSEAPSYLLLLSACTCSSTMHQQATMYCDFTLVPLSMHILFYHVHAIIIVSCSSIVPSQGVE